MIAKAFACTTVAWLAIGLWSGPTLASSRTFVSPTGVDTGTCPPAAPCATFAYAVTQTSQAGELVVLGPGEYGPVTITQSISIVNDGVGTSSVTATSGGTGITIAAGTGDVVQLRGLEIEGAVNGVNGILLTSGGELDVVNCVIRNFHGNSDAGGIVINGSSNVYVYGSILSGNATGMFSGFFNPPLADHLTLVDDKIMGNTPYQGLFFEGSSEFITMKRCTISGNGSGLQTIGVAAAIVSDSEITDNGIGIQVSGGATYMDRTTVVGNNTGLSNDGSAGGFLISHENNYLNANTTETSGTITKSAPY